MTFAFHAEVTEITRNGGATFDLPFAVSPGDAVTGELQLEPLLFGERGVASSLRAFFSAEEFSVEEVNVVTRDNVFLAVGMTVVGPNDSISVASWEGASGVLTTSASNVLLAGMGLGIFSSNDDILHQGDDLSEAEHWNELPIRRLALEFGSSTGPGTVTVLATVGPMIAVPEPPTSYSLIAIFGLIYRILKPYRLG